MNKLQYYVLVRGGDKEEKEYQIVSVLEGSNPLYGHGSWDLFSGPFATWKKAEQSLVKEQ